MQLQALGEILAEATTITKIVVGLFVFYNHFHFDSRIKREHVLLSVSIYISYIVLSWNVECLLSILNGSVALDSSLIYIYNLSKEIDATIE